MNRKMFDCRDLPGECTLAISGQEEEVVRAQAEHAISLHKALDDDQLRPWIRSLLKDESAMREPALPEAAR